VDGKPERDDATDGVEPETPGERTESAPDAAATGREPDRADIPSPGPADPARGRSPESLAETAERSAATGAAGRGGESTIADGKPRPVDPAWVMVQRVAAGIAAAAILVPASIAALLVIALVDGLPWIGAVGITAGILALAVLLLGSAIGLPPLRYRYLRYCVDPGGLTIRSGIWWRSDVRVPRSRVQHTDVTQGPLERANDIATLVVFTAGTEHARVSLDGLPADRAARIRDFLVEPGEGDGV
jgi:membrane protein YdbS with pleckstrin-like domain